MILPTYQESNFRGQPLTCKACYWKGEGDHANVIDFYGVGNSKEIHCPECDEKICLLEKDEGRPGANADDFGFQLS
jgi:hypothetical protein